MRKTLLTVLLALAAVSCRSQNYNFSPQNPEITQKRVYYNPAQFPDREGQLIPESVYNVPEYIYSSNPVVETRDRVNYIRKNYDPDYANRIGGYRSVQEHIDAETWRANPSNPQDVRDAQIRANQIRERYWYQWLRQRNEQLRKQGVNVQPHQNTTKFRGY